MGRPPKIDKHKLIGMLADNYNDSEIARKLGVSHQAVSKMRGRLKRSAESGSKSKLTQQFIGARLNAQEQMSDLHQKSVWLLDQLFKAMKGEPHELKPFMREKTMQWIEKDATGKKTTKSQKEIEKMQFKTDPIQLSIMSMENIKGLWKTWLEILNYANPIEEAKATIGVILDWLERKYDPDVREQIIAEVRERLGRGPLFIQLRRETEAGDSGVGTEPRDERLPGGEPPGTEEGD